jgi:hypothetical protein
MLLKHGEHAQTVACRTQYCSLFIQVAPSIGMIAIKKNGKIREAIMFSGGTGGVKMGLRILICTM